jgi:hypothetical protein
LLGAPEPERLRGGWELRLSASPKVSRALCFPLVWNTLRFGP